MTVYGDPSKVLKSNWLCSNTAEENDDTGGQEDIRNYEVALPILILLIVV